MKQGGISPERQRRLSHTPRGPPSSSHRAPASRHSALGAGRTYSPRSQPREAARSAQTKGREIQVGIARNVSAGRPTASSPKWMRVSTRSGWSGSWEFELPGGCNQGVHPRADPGAPVAIPPKPHPHGGSIFVRCGWVRIRALPTAAGCFEVDSPASLRLDLACRSQRTYRRRAVDALFKAPPRSLPAGKVRCGVRSPQIRISADQCRAISLLDFARTAIVLRPRPSIQGEPGENRSSEY